MGAGSGADTGKDQKRTSIMKGAGGGRQINIPGGGGGGSHQNPDHLHGEAQAQEMHRPAPHHAGGASALSLGVGDGQGGGMSSHHPAAVPTATVQRCLLLRVTGAAAEQQIWLRLKEPKALGK